MISQIVTIKNPTGLHLRPAGMFCKRAAEYEGCSITFQVGNTTGSAKSVLSVLAACIKQGDEIEIFCNGENEKQALTAMVHLVEEELEE